MTITENTTAWLRRYHPAPRSTRRLVCFPHAGGSASFFHPVSARFAPEVDVVAVQYPGRQDRRHEPCVEDIGLLADLIAEELREQPAKPTVFFGHSMGAAVAFETAWRLERADHGPGVLLVSGSRAPSLPRDDGVGHRDDDGVLAELRRLEGTPQALLEDEDVLRMTLPVIRGDYRAIESYSTTVDHGLTCPVTVLIGDRDPNVSLAEAASWREHTTGGFQQHIFPGGHFYLVDHAAEVGDRIGEALAGS
ncbi:alpha/beta fold hydrolase [Saccharopolyspora sp. NFXS83]|uniref:thioesterase II family protein n=1 Tax=Saccharopolyspora sp. NFXS83 TaxID=2993560 RepID=UPI00224A844D|nr:alpha/beta fold hydrolase [Saccharopolyspora sp. NFXS83]MCX2731044.1 alpha/beta fold hydrolase [Saccharopolyspora sp. NFXS83]